MFRGHRLHKWRSFRYSLSTMLAVITVVCAWLGIFAGRVHRQRNAAAALRGTGATYFYDEQHSRLECRAYHVSPNLPGPDWLRELAGIDFVGNVTRVFVGYHSFPPRFGDSQADQLRAFPELRILKLSCCDVTDEGLACLPKLPNLEQLVIRRTPITDAGLKYLAGHAKLQFLDLGSPDISDLGLRQLVDLPNLSSLSLSSAPITDRGLLQLASLPSLRKLRVCHQHLTPAGVDAFHQAAPKCRLILLPVAAEDKQ